MVIISFFLAIGRVSFGSLQPMHRPYCGVAGLGFPNAEDL